jgi:ketosteroid isomerase-like protein
MKLKRYLPAALAALLLALAYAAGGAAQTTSKRGLPPLPAGERGLPRRLAPVVEAEHAFAQYSIDHGMKEAFLRFAAPDGVIVRREPVNAIESWSKREPPKGLLTWWPVYADVSQAGDMGWTTGPYEFRDNPSSERPDDTGHFFTVWRRQPDGSWKFVLDLGVRHPAPARPETVLRYPPSLRKGGAFRAGGRDAESARSSLLAAERSLSADSSTRGTTTALLTRADESLRLYRQNSLPLVGREAVGKALKVMTEFGTWKPLRADVAASGDLGYAYGTYEVRANSSDGSPAERGNYARVWKRGPGGVWRVVFNVANPVPPEGR